MQYECNTDDQATMIATDTGDTPVPEQKETSGQEISKSEALRMVRERWPEAFKVASPRPLKVGIHKDMKESGEFPLPVIKNALKLFTTQERYLLAIKSGRNRINLEGKPCGKVKLKEAVNAEITLFQRHENQARKDQRVHVGQLKLVQKTAKKPAKLGGSCTSG